MFERFTNRARHVVVVAQEEARRLNHNYIGTEHILLGLVGETDGQAAQALSRYGMSLDGVRAEVEAIVGRGKSELSGHIPFTPRAKKTLELALREALALHHNYIGTEHILLGVIGEGDGVGAQVLRQHGDLTAIRASVLEMVPAAQGESARGRRWLRRRPVTLGDPSEAGTPAEQTLSATPAADTTLTEAARLAGNQPVGSHHLLLAALADPDTAAARALAALGVDLEQAKEALREMDVAGTSDEQPEEAGRRQMVIHVTDNKLTLEASDQLIVKAAQAAAQALSDSEGTAAGTISGELPASASLSRVWQALHESLTVIQRTAASPGESSQSRPSASGDQGSEVA